jgi:hypothetical protein
MALPTYPSAKGHDMKTVAITAGRIMPQGFLLPSIPAIALPILGHVVFPGTKQVGRGVLSDADRVPPGPFRGLLVGPSTYTMPPSTQRVGGQYRVRVGDLT